MKLGTRSTLFGVHQFILHPLLVWLTWVRLYRSFPSWREFVCIFVHDLGYLGCVDMDGDEGSRHPEFGAAIALRLYGEVEQKLVLFHSRFTANAYGEHVSRLCAPDKLVIFAYPPWAYTTLAWFSGEYKEYQVRLGLTAVPVTQLIHHFRVRAYNWAMATSDNPEERTAIRMAFGAQYVRSARLVRSTSRFAHA